MYHHSRRIFQKLHYPLFLFFFKYGIMNCSVSFKSVLEICFIHREMCKIRVYWWVDFNDTWNTSYGSKRKETNLPSWSILVNLGPSRSILGYIGLFWAILVFPRMDNLDLSLAIYCYHWLSCYIWLSLIISSYLWLSQLISGYPCPYPAISV